MKTAKELLDKINSLKEKSMFIELEFGVEKLLELIASLEEKIELMDGAFNELFHDIGQRLVKLESKDSNTELTSIDINP